MKPDRLTPDGRYDSFDNGKVLFLKKKQHLPAMGWNSWNAFGSGNTEDLTKCMGEKIVSLGLDKLGYKYVVLDDGCYKPERVAGKLSNEEGKFPDDFSVLADFLHKKGLKFGMYNDIGTNLCAGAAVGTCGHEAEDAESYLNWGVDFLKVDNCYYPFDNATFSNPENARFTFAPNIRSIRIDGKEYKAEEGKLTGTIAKFENGYATWIGTYDGTGPFNSPVGEMGSELVFDIEASEDKEATLEVLYATGKHEGVGEWLEIFVGENEFYDDFLEATEAEDAFKWSVEIKVSLKKGNNKLRLMNHRRQENTLNSYARLLKELNRLAPDNDIIYSACEWGKTQPQNWGRKVCDSWRILNDITFRVGRDGDPGFCGWKDDYTCSVTTQYNKAVIMDEFAGLDKGWNDPDMMVIGMNGLTEAMNRTHMAMWCMMNSPLMLGIDLRRVEKGDWIYNIIANERLIALNQDALGIQAKRIYSNIATTAPDKEYIRNTDRVDILAKPLSDGNFALSFINLSETGTKEKFSIDVKKVMDFIGNKLPKCSKIAFSKKFMVTDLWSGEETINDSGVFSVDGLGACENVTVKVSAAE